MVRRPTGWVRSLAGRAQVLHVQLGEGLDRARLACDQSLEAAREVLASLPSEGKVCVLCVATLRAGGPASPHWKFHVEASRRIDPGSCS